MKLKWYCDHRRVSVCLSDYDFYQIVKKCKPWTKEEVLKFWTDPDLGSEFRIIFHFFQNCDIYLYFNLFIYLFIYLFIRLHQSSA